MRPTALVAALGITMGCSRPRPHSPNAPPDLLVVVVPASWGAVPPPELSSLVAHFPAAQPVHTDPATMLRSLVTGQWPGTASNTQPNTLMSVLGLYGYTTFGVPPRVDLSDDSAFVLAGLDAGPFQSGACLATQLAKVPTADLQPNDEALFALLAGPTEGCDPSKDQAALADLLSGAAREHLWTVVLSLDPLDWRTPPVATPLYVAGPGVQAGARDGLASVVDVMPTLLPRAKAVVPSDASGTNLQAALDGEEGPRVVFQQDSEARVGIRTPSHLLWLDPLSGPLPDSLPEGGVHFQSLDGSETTSEAGIPPLYATLVSWDRQRRATTAAERMGSGAFKDMLRDQGYWH